MTRKWSNLNLPGALHFVTGNLINRLPVVTERPSGVARSFRAKPLWSGWMIKQKID